MDDESKQRINHETIERLKKIASAAGLSQDRAPTPIELLKAVREEARELVDLAIWRLEQPDIIGRKLIYQELKAMSHALDALAFEVNKVAVDRTDGR